MILSRIISTCTPALIPKTIRILVPVLREFIIGKETMCVFILDLPSQLVVVCILRELLEEEVMAPQNVLIISGNVTEEMCLTPR